MSLLVRAAQRISGRVCLICLNSANLIPMSLTLTFNPVTAEHVTEEQRDDYLAAEQRHHRRVAERPRHLGLHWRFDLQHASHSIQHTAVYVDSGFRNETKGSVVSSFFLERLAFRVW